MSKIPASEYMEYNKFIKDAEPCEDAVSREDIKKIAKEMYLEVGNMELDVHTISDCISYTASKCRQVLVDKLNNLPPVTPARKKGKWIYLHDNFSEWNGVTLYFKCSECGRKIQIDDKAESTLLKYYPYCHCGSEMER